MARGQMTLIRFDFGDVRKLIGRQFSESTRLLCKTPYYTGRPLIARIWGARQVGDKAGASWLNPTSRPAKPN